MVTLLYLVAGPSRAWLRRVAAAVTAASRRQQTGGDPERAEGSKARATTSDAFAAAGTLALVALDKREADMEERALAAAAAAADLEERATALAKREAKVEERALAAEAARRVATRGRATGVVASSSGPSIGRGLHGRGRWRPPSEG